MFTLKVFRGDRIVQELDLNGPEVKIGRSPDNPVVLADDGKGVSRVHAIIRVEGDDFVLYDGNSRNGTFVDGKPIKRMVIEPGQDFVIGPYRLVFGAGDVSGSMPTVVASRPTPPPGEIAPEGTAKGAGKEGTAKGAGGSATSQMKRSEGSTKSRPAALGQPPASARPGQRQGMPVAYVAIGAVALLVVAGVLVWQLMPGSSPEDELAAVTTTTTSIPPETTSSVPVTTTVDPYAEQIAQATLAVEAAEATLAAKRLPPAAREFDRILKEQIAPILAADPQYQAAIDLETRVKASIAEIRKQTEIVKTSVVVARKRGPEDVPEREGESPQDYDRRNAEVKTDYALAKKYFNDGEFLSALKIFTDLASREPGYLDVGAYVKNSQERLDEARRVAMNAALSLEGEGHKLLNARSLPEAASKLTEARAAFERAAALGAPGVEKQMADNLERRRLVGKEALNRARTHANQRNRAEAQKWYQLVIDVLPAGDPMRGSAESELKRVAPDSFDASTPQPDHAASPFVRRSL
jgi:pSer/pThr/pTyr-binding forkhead associated (FHA) protein/tetratricopeptide (TPR) repeat protein